MEASSSKFVVKLLPSLTDFAFLMPIVFLFGRMEGVKTLLSDCDTGWHIRTGEWILANGWVPAQDVFSFSKPGAPWYAWEWLSGIVLAKINALGGLQAVVLFSILMLSVTFTGLFLLVRRKASPVVAIPMTMLAAAASSIHWLARPHLFAVFPGSVLRGPRAGSRRPRSRGRHSDSGRLPGHHDSVDQPARRLLRRHPDDRSLRRGGDVAIAIRRRRCPGCGVAQVAILFRFRRRVPGGEPDQSLHLSPARAHGGVSPRSEERRVGKEC